MSYHTPRDFADIRARDNLEQANRDEVKASKPKVKREPITIDDETMLIIKSILIIVSGIAAYVTVSDHWPQMDFLDAFSYIVYAAGFVISTYFTFWFVLGCWITVYLGYANLLVELGGCYIFVMFWWFFRYSIFGTRTESEYFTIFLLALVAWNALNNNSNQSP